MFEMNLTDQANLQEIAKNVVVKNTPWFSNNGILIGNKGNFWMLNYIQGFPVNEFNVLTRGLVISQDNGQIVSMPFKRFGNYGEDAFGFKSFVDFSKSEVLEKLDGSMLVVSFYNGKLFYHTKRMISGFSKGTQKGFDGNEIDLMKVAEGFVKELNFSSEDHNKTWVFEFIHNQRPVITQYNPNQIGLYLIGARDLSNFAEYSEPALDDVAIKIGAKRPRRWGVIGSHEAVKQMMSQFPDDFEGFIVRQMDNGQRAKVKNIEYLKRHSLIGNSTIKQIIPLWLKGESSEILTYFPESKIKFEMLDRAFVKKVASTTFLVTDILHANFPSKKELSFALKKQKIDAFESSMAFNCFGQPKEMFSQLIEEQIKKLSVDRMINLLNLSEE